MERDLHALIDPKQPLPCSLGVVARQSRLEALARIERERKNELLWFEQSFPITFHSRVAWRRFSLRHARHDRAPDAECRGGSHREASPEREAAEP